MRNLNNLFLERIICIVISFYLSFSCLVKVNPLFNLIPSPAKVKLWFMSGGCQKFLDVFLLILPQIRKKRQDGAENIIRDLNAGNLEKKYAYVDPSDPSVIFVTQPQNANVPYSYSFE